MASSSASEAPSRASPPKQAAGDASAVKLGVGVNVALDEGVPVALDEPVPVLLDDGVPVRLLEGVPVWLPVPVALDEPVPVELDEGVLVVDVLAELETSSAASPAITAANANCGGRGQGRKGK